MPQTERPPTIYFLLASVHEPQIVLAALTRLRWIAVIGQVTATLVAVALLHLRLPLAMIAAVILMTAASNAVLVAILRWIKPQGWLVPVVLLLDICLLTALLYLTGGPQNPFASLYLVHVAMAVIVLGAGWTWTVVATVAACYAVLFVWHRPLSRGEPLPTWATLGGDWTALVLVSVLIASFIGRVIRSLRHREGELAAARERGARNEQLAALTTLAAGAAHELNTPLGTIAVVARELEVSCPDHAGSCGPGSGSKGPGVSSGDGLLHASALIDDSFVDSVRDDARLIRREVDRCRAILGRMRLDVDDDTARRTPVAMTELAERLRQNLRDAEVSRLAVRIAPDVQQAMLPELAIEQALLVLLRNAFDASGPTQVVTLDIIRNSEGLRFEVRDQGPGMPEELIRHVGEPFFTTKQPGAGMGLGVFLVRLVAERCGGRFSIDSRPGQGTCCVLEVPGAGS